MSVQPVYGAQQPVYGAQQPVYGAQQPVYGAQQPVYGAQPIIQQPMGTQARVQQPQGDVKMVGSKEGHRTWTTDMFDCFDENTSCLFTWCCPCFTMAEVANRMGENCAVAILVPGGMLALRARLRTLGGIKGNVCGDALSLCFCGLCSLGQMERELRHMGL